MPGAIVALVKVRQPFPKVTNDKTPSVVDITKENPSQLSGVSNNAIGFKDKQITNHTPKKSGCLFSRYHPHVVLFFAVTRFDASQIKHTAFNPAKMPRRSRWQ
jgi:hypothetical protein